MVYNPIAILPQTLAEKARLLVESAARVAVAIEAREAARRAKNRQEIAERNARELALQQQEIAVTTARLNIVVPPPPSIDPHLFQATLSSESTLTNPQLSFAEHWSQQSNTMLPVSLFNHPGKR